MKSTRLPSGNYRVQKMVDGKKYSLTFDHKPSEKDVLNAIIDRNAPVTSPEAQTGLSFRKATQEYIELKRERISPRYVKELKNLPNHFSEAFCQKDIGQITQIDIDKEVSAWLKRKLTYKSQKNYFTQMSSVMQKFRPDFKPKADMLPEKPKKEDVYIPTNADVAVLLKYFQQNEPQFYAAFWISCYGLRRGETCALEIDDLDENNVLHVTKDIVQNEFNEWVVKPPKTLASVRDVPIPSELADLIRRQGFIYRGNPHSLNKALKRVQKVCGVEEFSWHKMRHYCCTELFDMGCSETDVMAFLGWEEESEVMRTVYKHSRLKQDKDRQRSISDRLTEKFF